jgi:hypothetical protein
MLNCRQTSKLASDRLERRLTFTERTGFWMHVLVCPVCRRFARHIAWMNRFLRRAAALDEVRLAQLGRSTRIDRERIVRALRRQ